ncbi:hypothetical protein [Psychrobacillus psychrotolerans]|uniref:hypothetical protein n=1 Tax=Psychrobacillus psychrotolerans TaxID=126156 RepID=UPI0015876264|nr:hypothetical protein [Psychrobacillus psychrotolerans]
MDIKLSAQAYGIGVLIRFNIAIFRKLLCSAQVIEKANHIWLAFSLTTKVFL